MFSLHIFRVLPVCLVVFFVSLQQPAAAGGANESGSTQTSKQDAQQAKISKSQSVKPIEGGPSEFKNKANHETASPSSYGSLYSNAPDSIQNYYVQATGQDLGSPRGTAALALGAENQAGSSIDIPTDDNRQVARNLMLDHPMTAIYNNRLATLPSQQQANLQPSNQVLASLYIDQYGNQQLRLPSDAQVNPAGQINQLNADSISKSFYSPLQQQVPVQSTSSNMLYTSNQQSTEDGQRPLMPSGKKGSLQSSQEMQRTRVQAEEDEPKFSGELSLGQPSSNSKNTLSNAQLMSLIDELKDFNSRQTTANGSKSPDHDRRTAAINMDETLDNEDDDIDIDPSSMDTRHSSASEVKPREPAVRSNNSNGNSNSSSNNNNNNNNNISNHPTTAAVRQTSSRGPDLDKVSADDLAKFARFLMTKEGANMRFQLGLEKDSPDDGDIDEEEKDALLESKSSQRSANKLGGRNGGSIKESKDPNEHQEVAKQMDSLIEKLTGTLNMAEKAQERRNKKNGDRREKDEDAEMESDDRRARSRRNSRERAKRRPTKSDDRRDGKQADESVSLPAPPSKRATSREKGHNKNLAQKLIDRELTQDQLESAIQKQHRSTDGQGPSSEATTTDNGLTGSPRSHKRSKRSKTNQNMDAVELGGGETGENYSLMDRNKDRSALLRDLRKIRRDKSEARSGVSSAIVREPILRQALDGRLGMRTESQPGGRIVLTSGRGQSMAIKLPDKSDSTTMVTHDVMNDDHQNNGDPEGRISDGPSGGKLNHINIMSGKQLKDEYPISERVSNRLNSLSENLDRYFNDGFMGAIGQKSRVDDGRAGGHERHQVDSSNIDEKAAKSGASRGRGDQDFDVDVGIDGRRDSPDKDNNDYHDDDDQTSQSGKQDDGDDQNSSKDDSTSSRSAEKDRGKVGLKHRRIRRERNERPEPEESPRAHSVDGVNLEPSKADEKDGGSLKQKVSAGNEHLTFENGEAKVSAKVDPVDGEDFESPIGPDTENLDLIIVPTAGDKTVESSHESKNIISKYGKKMTPKFFEEPEW
jgi:hypothetical protein